MNKKTFNTMIVLFLCLAVIICVSRCGMIGSVKTKKVDSKLYSQMDIRAAIGVVKREFRLNYDDCSLKEIHYAGDKVSRANQKAAKEHDADEALVLTSTFYSGKTDAGRGLKAGTTVKGWRWVVVRKAGGRWQLAKAGRK